MTAPRDEPQQHPLDRFEITREQLETLQDYVGGKYCRVNQTIAFHTIKDIYDSGCCSHSANTDAQAQIDAVVKELEETLEHSKEKLCGFTAEEAGWVGGYESGLSVAIALLKEGVGK